MITARRRPALAALALAAPAGRAASVPVPVPLRLARRFNRELDVTRKLDLITDIMMITASGRRFKL